jgi:uncharacterized protein (DUF4415 family)
LAREKKFIRRVGRPLQGKTLKKHCTLRLEQATIERVRRYGKGSFQNGIERLIELKWRKR